MDQLNKFRELIKRVRQLKYYAESNGESFPMPETEIEEFEKVAYPIEPLKAPQEMCAAWLKSIEDVNI